jgi:chemotaxis protein MotB
MGKPPEKPKPCPKGAPGWMVSFGDLMSLLLTFFILLLSFSTMDIVKYKEVAGEVKNNFGVQKKIPVYENPVGTTLIATHFDPKLEEDIITKLKATVKRYKKSSEEVEMKVFKDSRGIVLRVSGNYIFDKGSYVIKPVAWPFLEDVINIYKKTRNVELYVEAHTDSTPINSKEIPTNWELSALRAVAIVRFFNEESKVEGFLLHAVGRGDSVPLFPNNSKINRMRNRRVEFIFSTIKKGIKK